MPESGFRFRGLKVSILWIKFITLIHYFENAYFPTLFNKVKYVLRVRNLSIYKDFGMKLTKIHRMLYFNESPCLVKYIDFNTNKKILCKNAFEKDFF